jgi:uncharacterized protein YqgV (UPF0045/DUF77 family)
MKISVELSLYPLADEFLPIIQDIVERLNRSSTIGCYTNTMSTQLYGELDEVMRVVTDIISYSFRIYGKQVFVAKFLNSDVEPK